MARVLLTGAAGFIGYHTTERLLARGDEVIGIDNLNSYYDVRLKESRLARLSGKRGWQFRKIDVADQEGMNALFQEFRPDRVVHLAAQAGVRYSLQNPHAYVQANLVGFMNILEGCRHLNVGHLVYASSSSVYGANSRLPFRTTDNVDHPISLYAASKKANELMAHTYSHLFNLPTTGLRFFTVYGPWGRPDMAMFLFVKAILAGESIDVFNHGDMQRDFTYVDDIVEGILRVLDRVPASGTVPVVPGVSSRAPYRVYNIGNNNPVELMDVIHLIERLLGRETQKRMLPMQPGDVKSTYADVDDLYADVGFRPTTPIESGISRFIDWYLQFYGAK